MNRSFVLLTGAVLLGVCVSAMAEENDLFKRAPWTFSPGLSYTIREGDEPVEDSLNLSLKLGYDQNARVTYEFGVDIMPSLKHRTWENPNKYQIDKDTWGVRFGGDAFLHLRNIKDLHFDPYIGAGLGLTYYADDLSDGHFVPSVQGDLGFFYHFNDEWALRADYRYELISIELKSDGRAEQHQTINLSANYRFGAKAQPRYEVLGGDIDSDNDGLLDEYEMEIGTDPYNADTDGDGLSDGAEVNDYKTDPLNADTDWDALKDGAEVLTYLTDPLVADTDGGGVADGHEVIEDLTDPLDPADDLQLYSLNIEFDYDKADIRPEYYDQLDVIVKVLERDPNAVAKVEGHADKRPKSDRKYNINLSSRRAKSVVEYLVDVGGINQERLSYKGYGFDRPIAPNDTEANMQKNRRTDIYIGSPTEIEEVQVERGMGASARE
jgi:outer membrane protein OmpA-like peptidoglycan-associated protein